LVEGPRGVAPGRVRRAGQMHAAGREDGTFGGNMGIGWSAEAEYPTFPRSFGEDIRLR
jgi:hypothetical protein